MSIRRKAWRNAMVATINEALDRRLFSLEPDDKEMDVDFNFEVDGFFARANVSTIGWDEIHAHVSLLPKGQKYAFMASGWLERRKGKWLQTPPHINSSVSCNDVAHAVAAIQIEPKGYADHGRFFL